MHTVEAIKHLFIGYGAAWVLWLLAGLSVVSVAVAQDMGLCLEEGAFANAENILQKHNTAATRIALAGLRLRHLGPSSVQKAIESAHVLEKTSLEKRLAYLGTLGNNAPFVGLFGTVIGVIQAFEELGHGTPGHALDNAAQQVASQAVMSGIAEALVATAVGIAVALPAVALYNYLQRRMTVVLAQADVLCDVMMAYLLRKDG
jgi:biopolymer transport protein ExbB